MLFRNRKIQDRQYNKSDILSISLNKEINTNPLDKILKDKILKSKNKIVRDRHYKTDITPITKKKDEIVNESRIFIISNIKGGGTEKFVNDLFKHNNNCYIINNFNKLLMYNFNEKDLIILQQLFFIDISIDDIINLKLEKKCMLIVCIHDFYWLNENIEKNFNDSIFWHNNYLNKNIYISPKIKKLFEISNKILHPSYFTYNEYSKYFPTKNFEIKSWSDYKVDYSCKNIPEIKNKMINIGVLHEFSVYKGKENIELLSNKYKYYNNYKIEFRIVSINIPNYDEKKFFEFLEIYNIHALTFLNKWGETYCYYLTKGINSGLPLIYNNIGSFKERIIENDHYFKVYDNENENDPIKLYKMFEKMLDYIIENNGRYHKKNIDMTLYKSNLLSNEFELFAIYFPQFHKIKENDINYYEDYTDFNNLEKYLDKHPENLNKLDKPFISLYNLEEYNLENNELITKQIQLAKSYNIKGFGIYYYWFSTNSITNQNVIMEKGYMNFFIETLDNFKIFFIWANEDWSNNPAFNSEHDIFNIYNLDNIEKNCNHLIPFFKSENYYKIDNKPLFFIHHPWFIDDVSLDLFYRISDKKCKENGFDGINLVLNSMNKNYDNFSNYQFHPNYKNPPNETFFIKDGKNTLDYEKYVDKLNIDDYQINTIFFDFNNIARLFNTSRKNLYTQTINNTDKNIYKYIDKIKNKIKNKNKLFNIILINAWNEWGEKMHIEPGQSNKFRFLNLMKHF